MRTESFQQPIPLPEEGNLSPKPLEQQIFEQSNLVEVKPEDRNENGQLLVSPEGLVSKLDEQEWKMVRTEAFKQWFGESMVTDGSGEPLVLYHGSSKKFDKFDVSKVGANSGENKDSGYFGTGFYFTPHQGLAEKYGPVLYKSFLRVNHIQTFSNEHGNVRFDESPLPENIRDAVLKRYKPLQEAEYRRLQEQEEKNKGDWSYVSSWNGSDKFEHILSDVIRQVLLDQGFDGVIGYNQVSNLYEYAVFNQDDILVISQKEKESQIATAFIFPDVEKERGEIERVAQKYNPQNPEVFVRTFYERVQGAKLVDLTEEMWRVLDNTDSFEIALDGWKEVAAQIEHTNKETGAERNWEDLKQKMEQGRELDAPIIFKHAGELHLVSGNTRLMVARAFGIVPKVLIVEI